jgi:hypothetical protein
MEKKAGIEAFQRFSYYNTINSLADGDITKWEEIMNYSYSKLLVKLQLNKTEAAYQKRYAELLKAQQPTV